MRSYHSLEVLCLGLWTGAGLSFALITPLFFSLLPSRQLAGDLAGAALGRLQPLWVLLLIVALWSLTRRARADTRPARRYRWFFLLAALLLVLADMTWVQGRMGKIRSTMDRPIDAYASSDPLRRAYGRWHGLSQTVSAFAYALTAGAWVWAVVEPPRPAAPGRKEEGDGLG